MTPNGLADGSYELRAANKPLNGRRCRRCGNPLSGRQKDFCGFGPGSCHRLYYSEARKIGSMQMVPEESRRDRLLFGKNVDQASRLGSLVEAANRVINK